VVVASHYRFTFIHLEPGRSCGVTPCLIIKAKDMIKPKVLIVEDDELLRQLTLDLVEDCECSPLIAADADEAISLLQTHDDIALVLTDVEMPGSSMDGLELAHAVRRDWPELGIIVVSGRHDLATQELPEGAMFIRKPFGIENMEREIRRQVA
jgi:CheY-like chemotaxis protein